MIEKYSKKAHACPRASANVHKKIFCSEISNAFIFYARELNLVLKCRQMNKLDCGIIIIRG